MDDTDKIMQKLRHVAEELAREGISTRLGVDRPAGVVKIYSEKSDALKRALSGLTEVLELAYTSAEHHPYWGMLYHATEISKTVLEKWDSELSADNLSEISWRCDEIKMANERVGNHHGD